MQESKQSFFEKKGQKTFGYDVRDSLIKVFCFPPRGH
jgi:hypothetical protein